MKLLSLVLLTSLLSMPFASLANTGSACGFHADMPKGPNPNNVSASSIQKAFASPVTGSKASNVQSSVTPPVKQPS